MINRFKYTAAITVSVPEFIGTKIVMESKSTEYIEDVENEFQLFVPAFITVQEKEDGTVAQLTINQGEVLFVEKTCSLFELENNLVPEIYAFLGNRINIEQIFDINENLQYIESQLSDKLNIHYERFIENAIMNNVHMAPLTRLRHTYRLDVDSAIKKGGIKEYISAKTELYYK